MKLTNIQRTIAKLKWQREELKENGNFRGKKREFTRINIKLRNLNKRERYLQAG